MGESELIPPVDLYLYHLLWSGVDLLFPPFCGGCGVFGSRWCSTCQAEMMAIPEPFCQICGDITTGNRLLCPGCQNKAPAFRALRSAYVYRNPVRNGLIRLKYKNDLGLGEIFAKNCAEYLSAQKWKIDVVLPIPLSEQRMRERGYNQVNLIAYPLARTLGLKYLPKALHRVKHTKSQVGLNFAERRMNVTGAFEANPKVVKYKSILVVDDVATTGSTLDAAARALRIAGADEVYAFTFARAIQQEADHLHDMFISPHPLS